MIIRERYLNQIRPFIDSDLIKIITGIRRCGKSVILVQLKEELLKRTNNALPLTQVSLLQTLGVMLDLKDYVKVDEKYMTNINGVYAIGDMIDGVHQVASSVYQGMMCALKIIEEYKNA